MSPGGRRLSSERVLTGQKGKENLPPIYLFRDSDIRSFADGPLLPKQYSSGKVIIVLDAKGCRQKRDQAYR